MDVVSPIPYAPSWLPSRRWQSIAAIPKHETVQNLSVHHPRYCLVPKVSMALHGFLMFVGALPLVRRLHEQKDFECIDAHYVYPDGFAAVLLGKHLGIPVVVSARGTDVTLFPSFPLIRPMIQWALSEADGVVGVCEALTNAMIDLGASPERAQTIGNGIDPSRFESIDRSEARRKLGISLDSKIVLSVGNLVPVKGHKFLISAIARAAREQPTLKLYIVGEGELRKDLQLRAQAEGLADRVFFVGRKPNEELKFWYSAANVSCLASSREGWANVLLESLACGTPVVATRVWGTPEVITSPELGILVEQNVNSIASGLEAALRKTWDRDALVRKATSRTWELVAQEMEEFLRARSQVEPALSPRVSRA